jgi:hypothetical protein
MREGRVERQEAGGRRANGQEGKRARGQDGKRTRCKRIRAGIYM